MSLPALAAALDARLIPCSGKHEIIFRRWATLAVGESFILLNDHRPAPLQNQFEQLVPGCFEWFEIEPPPGAFAVRITRIRSDPAGFDPGIVNGCGLKPAGTSGSDDSILVQLQFDYRGESPALARQRLLRVASRLPDATGLLADLSTPDPELDRSLTALALTFQGHALPGATPAWRYTICRPRNAESVHQPQLNPPDSW
ncbi:MAG: DUF2249 domain-containing protein [Opitutaceae bacterium]|jgi:uncharacterized protein (DUF2249 family)|nr:DUF2249 domain-containing protein [Opitutaceae bacterium]